MRGHFDLSAQPGKNHYIVTWAAHWVFDISLSDNSQPKYFDNFPQVFRHLSTKMLKSMMLEVGKDHKLSSAPLRLALAGFVSKLKAQKVFI